MVNGLSLILFQWSLKVLFNSLRHAFMQIAGICVLADAPSPSASNTLDQFHLKNPQKWFQCLWDHLIQTGLLLYEDELKQKQCTLPDGERIGALGLSNQHWGTILGGPGQRWRNHRTPYLQTRREGVASVRVPVSQVAVNLTWVIQNSLKAMGVPERTKQI